MLSASHNPAPDNGIKFFARGGVKLPDAVEDEIEARLAGQAWRNVSAAVGQPSGQPAAPVGVPDPSASRRRVRPGARRDRRGRALPRSSAQHGARSGLAAPLAGLRVVVDCAHGAAAAYAPDLLRRAGADVIAIGTEPDGLNINEGMRLDQPGRAIGRGGGVRRGRWHRARRRRRPLPGRRRSRAGHRRRPDPGRARGRAQGRGQAGRRHSGRDGHVQSRLPARDARRRHRRGGDAGRRPLPDRGHARRQVRPRRRAVWPHHHARPRDDRRRAADRPALAGRGGAPGPAARRSGQRDDEVPAGADQRSRREQGTGRLVS